VQHTVGERDTSSIMGRELAKSIHDLDLLHIPKAAGTSIEHYGEAHGVGWGSRTCRYPCGPEYQRNGTCDISRWHDPSLAIDSRDTFCVIRDPLERWVSEYRYQKLVLPDGIVPRLSEWSRSVLGTLSKNETCSEYISDGHFIPQIEYIKHCDWIIRYDRLDDGFAALMALYNDSHADPLPHDFRCSFNFQRC
jgi:hypothetical protein